MNENAVHEQAGTVVISEEAVTQFLEFLEKQTEYLDTGMGAFHTDNHSNW